MLAAARIGWHEELNASLRLETYVVAWAKPFHLRFEVKRIRPYTATGESPTARDSGRQDEPLRDDYNCPRT